MGKRDTERDYAGDLAPIREPRAPADLTNARLRTLAAALGPLYVRYGGTTTNSVYFQDNDEPRLEESPEGYGRLLTRKAWKGALEFAEAVDARVVTGFTVSEGVRDESGIWTPTHAAPWLAYTQSIGGELYAAEMFNEPNMAAYDKMLKDYDAARFAKDFAAFHAFMKKAAPNLKVAGPGDVEVGLYKEGMPGSLTAEDYLSANPKPQFDILSYHYYGALSERCAPPDSERGISAEEALSEDWLARQDRSLQRRVALEIGGPGYMQYNETWMYAFLDRYADDPSPDKKLDFLSWHAYGRFPEGTGDSSGPRAFHFYKGNPSEIAGERELLNAALSSRGLDTEIPAFITETGIYPGPSYDHKDDPRPDYLIGAAGVPSLHYWYMEQPDTYPFNWVVRHAGEKRKDQLISRARDGEHIAVKGTENVEDLPTNIFTPYGNALKMMVMLKRERVAAHSDALDEGKGIYSIATRDEYGVAVMVWNYQHIEQQTFAVMIDMGELPANLRGRPVRQQMFRIDDQVSNYWADPVRANLQMISESVLEPGENHSVPVDLTPNALQSIVLEPVK